MEVKKAAEEWEILDNEEEAAKYKEEAKKLDVDKEVVGLYNGGERSVCAKERQGISVIKRRERRDT